MEDGVQLMVDRQAYVKIDISDIINDMK